MTAAIAGNPTQQAKARYAVKVYYGRGCGTAIMPFENEVRQEQWHASPEPEPCNFGISAIHSVSMI